MAIKRATAAVIVKEGKILIAQRRKDGKWEFPGGKFEEGETPEECVIREIKEELDLSVRVEKLLCVIKGDFRNQTMELFVFLVTPVSGEVSLNVHKEVQWVTQKEFPTYDFLEEDKQAWKYISS